MLSAVAMFRCSGSAAVPAPPGSCRWRKLSLGVTPEDYWRVGRARELVTDGLVFVVSSRISCWLQWLST